MAKLRKIPKFKNEDKEREFWAAHDVIDYFDFAHPLKGDFINLKPSTKMVTIRMPEGLLNNLRILANKKDVPYQSLLKVFLAEKVSQEFQTYST